MSSTPEGV